MSLMHPAISRSVWRGKRNVSRCKEMEAVATYQLHESVGVVLLLLRSAAIWLALGAELLAHSGAVVVHLSGGRRCCKYRICKHVDVRGVLRVRKM